MQYYEEQSRAISNEVYEMLKHKPAPIAGKDGMGRFGGMTAKGLEYARERRDEIAERVEKGLAAVPGEKLRVLWTVTRPTFMDEYKVLAKWGIAVFKSMGGGGEHPIPPYFGGRKLTPLEKVAARAMNDGFGCPGYSWINDIIRICKDLRIDAIVNYNMLGCTATLGLKKMVEDAAEKELGIPTLQLEGKQIDDSYANEAVITAKLDEFAQMLLSIKNLN
jgi:benzoyl-CoA reductase/2-hydroxyglutaryl-CoA dehydratase subunit BcrC/BadD/HgdB